MSGAIIIQLDYQNTSERTEVTGMDLTNAAATVKFRELFIAYHKNLRLYAFTIVKNEMLAEEIVQNVFCRLWENGSGGLDKVTQAYLYKAVYNESLNQLKSAKIKAGHHARMQQMNETIESTHDRTDLRQLSERATKALNSLPEQCRTIFQLSRYEQLKYREIADRLGISVKTVEAQMSKALRILREKLADYLPVILLLIIGTKK